MKVPFLYQRVLTAHSPAYSGVPVKTTDNQKPRPREGRSAPAPSKHGAKKRPPDRAKPDRGPDGALDGSYTLR